MKYGFSILAAILAGCSSDGERPGVQAPRDETVSMKTDEYAGFHIGREGTKKFIGYFEPVVTLDETYIKYAWRFRGAAQNNSDAILLYIDSAKSGYEMGVWRNKKIVAVGYLRENVVVGHERTAGFDTKKQIIASVLELVSIDAYSQEPEKLPSRVPRND